MQPVPTCTSIGYQERLHLWEQPFWRLQIPIYSDFIVIVNPSETKSMLLTLFVSIWGVIYWMLWCHNGTKHLLFWTVECAVVSTSVLLAWALWVCMWMWIYHQAPSACALFSRLEWEWIKDALDSAQPLLNLQSHLYPLASFSACVSLHIFLWKLCWIKVPRFCGHGMHHPILFCAQKTREHANCQIKNPVIYTFTGSWESHSSPFSAHF